MHIYNTHIDFGDKSKSDYDAAYTAVQTLVDSLESRFPTSRLYPPILLGDFNGDPPFPNFEVVGFAPNTDVIGVLLGTPDTFAARYWVAPTAIIAPVNLRSTESYCGSHDTLWSDHCAVFVSLAPMERPQGEPEP